MRNKCINQEIKIYDKKMTRLITTGATTNQIPETHIPPSFDEIPDKRLFTN